MLELLRARFQRGDFVVSEHALQQLISRSIALQEVVDAVAHCELIEDYPEDARGASALYFGLAPSGRPLHFQVSAPDRPIMRLVTVYEPDPARWLDYRLRKHP